MPDGMPMPPMPMLNRIVRQAPEDMPAPPGFMVAASEYAAENGLARVVRQAKPDGPPPPPARVVRSAPFHSESSKQVAQEVIYTNVVSVEREKRSAGKKSSGKKSSGHKKG